MIFCNVVPYALSYDGLDTVDNLTRRVTQCHMSVLSLSEVRLQGLQVLSPSATKAWHQAGSIAVRWESGIVTLKSHEGRVLLPALPRNTIQQLCCLDLQSLWGGTLDVHHYCW